MKKIRLIALALCFILVLAPVSVFAVETVADEGYDMDPRILSFGTQEDLDALITRAEECTAEFEGGDLKLTAKDLGSTNSMGLPDPRVYISYKKLNQTVNAEDYPYITLIYRMPETEHPEFEYQVGKYSTELFCNTNDTAPRGGQSVRLNPKVTGTKYASLIFNPGSLTEWQGTITSLRLDFFEWAFEGDTMYVHNILLSGSVTEAYMEAQNILKVLNAPKEMTLTFDVGRYGTAPAEQIVKRGENPVRPEDPTAEGFVFDDWYTGTDYVTKFDFNSPLVKENTVAYGKWSQVFEVTFNDGVSTSPVTSTVKANTCVDEPEVPAREGYTFRGWYADEAFANAYDFNTPVKNNLTLYAKWEEGVFWPVTVIDGTANPADAREGDSVTVTAVVPEGMAFDKWNVISGQIGEENLTKAEFTFTMPAGGVSLKATFREAAPFTPGDVNGDGNINARDISDIMKHILGNTPKGFIAEAADMDGSGNINAKDIVAIMKSMLNK